jgi:uncharacterized protein
MNLAPALIAQPTANITASIAANTAATAFAGGRCLAFGSLSTVALVAKAAVDAAANNAALPPVLLFNDATGETVELDWRGTAAEFAATLAALPQAAASITDALEEPSDSSASPKVGRPKLGVVAREVTLLPRHWEWLASQPGGASVALRKLVEVARRNAESAGKVRRSSAVGYKCMATLAGHEAGFEEASRALFAGDLASFKAQISGWPQDVQAYLMMLLHDAFAA